MKFLVHVLHVLSALVPDFFRLSPIAAEFVTLYRSAKACGLIPRTGLKLAAEIALAFAYLVALAVVIANELLRPARSSVGVLTRRAVHNPRDLLSRKRHYQSREERALATQP